MRHPRSTQRPAARPAALLLSLLAASPWALAADPVQVDSYRGWGHESPMQPPASNNVNAPRWLPGKALEPYYDNIPRLNSAGPSAGTPEGRFAALQRLLTHATPPGGNAVDSGVTGAPAPVAGTALTKTLPSLNIPSGVNVLCEYNRAGGTWPQAGEAACKNGIEGAVMYVAVHLPAAGYKLRVQLGNDGALIDANRDGGLGYRDLNYDQKLVIGATIGTPQGGYDATHSAALQEGLYNLRVAWNNWGSDANLNVQWVTPGGAIEDIPPSALFDPSNPATYIDAVDDDYTSTPIPAGVAATIGPVFANDSVNRSQATQANVASPELTATVPGITLNADGTLAVAGTTAVGTHTLSYKICNAGTKPDPLCDTATVKVRIDPDIAPQPDSGSATAGTAKPDAVPNIAANDLVNGQPATLGAGGNATVATVGAWPAGVTLDPNTGVVSTTAATPAGVHTLNYKLCDRATPTPNCQDSTITLTVNASIAPQPDSGSATAGTAKPDAVPNIAANDLVNGQPATLGAGGNATVATVGAWPAGVTLDPNTGVVSTTAATPAGVHTLNYKLCDRATPTPNCQDSTITLTVNASIAPQPDSGSATAGTAKPDAVPNIAANDLVNGQPATLGAGGNATVATVGAWPAGVTLDPNTGVVSTTAATPAGVHTLNYKLCDRATPTPNCQDSTITLTVSATPVAAADDIRPQALPAGTEGIVVDNIVQNDTINGQPATLGAGGNATVSMVGTWPAGITLDTNTGEVRMAASVPAGNYTLQYQLCDRSTPAQCVQAAIRFTVSAGPAPGSATPVPALGHWMLWLLSLATAALGLGRLRRF
ncbi:IPTL-CTERM sorting domain-containing protein [Vandammella animalimorsus]|nr:IPTL-CTERM sorting domain-containing protein [Vandammella animalimorsus]